MDNTDWMREPESTGTSIMAVEFDGGVVLGADSRTSMGSYIANRTSDKITVVTDHICCCRSGSSADTQAVAEIVSYRLELLKMELGEPVSVKIAANDFRQLCYNYRDALSAGIICAGWDRRNGGQVYSIPIGGMVSRQKVTIGGSGSGYIYGFVDKVFKPGMDKDTCVKFVTDALALAMGRDGSSGGVINIVVITEKGMERKIIPGDQVPRYIDAMV